MKDPEQTSWLNMNEGERPLYWEHPTTLVLIPYVVAAAVMTIMGIFITWSYFDIAGFYPLLLIPIGILIAVGEYLSWVTTHYVLTTRRVVRKEGVIRRDTDELAYEDITNTSDNQSIWERILRFGDIEVYTAGTSFSELDLIDIPKFSEASDILSERTTMETKDM